MKNRFSNHERSLRQVAAELGISYQRLSDYERGKHLPSKDRQLRTFAESGQIGLSADSPRCTFESAPFGQPTPV
ncbi:helix-turn-helix transcriptional regulator [bacterium]|nr:helix-turn-helix transcriptional regulator [bacterium]